MSSAYEVANNKKSNRVILENICNDLKLINQDIFFMRMH